MPDIAKWILVGIAVAFIAFDKAKAFFTNKKNGKLLKEDLKTALRELIKDGELPEVKHNPHPPGEALMCRQNRDLIMKHGEAIENIEKRLDRIEGKLNGTYRK